MYEEIASLHTVEEMSSTPTNDLDLDIQEEAKKIKNSELKKNWVHHDTRSEHEIALIALRKMKAKEKELQEKTKREVTRINNGFTVKYIK